MYISGVIMLRPVRVQIENQCLPSASDHSSKRASRVVLNKRAEEEASSW